MTRATSQHYGYAKQVLHYLKVVKHLKEHGVRKPSKPRFSVVSALASPMPAGPTTSLRATARCAMFCAATARLFHGNQLSLPSSLYLQVMMSSSVWLPPLKKWTFCRKFAMELGFIQPGPTPIPEDNTGAIALLRGYEPCISRVVRTSSLLLQINYS